MTDAQIVSIAITLFAIATGSIFNNVRISESAAMLNKRIDVTKDVLRAEMKVGFSLIDNQLAAADHRNELRFSSIDRKLDEILSILGRHDTRIEALERKLPSTL